MRERSERSSKDTPHRRPRMLRIVLALYLLVVACLCLPMTVASYSSVASDSTTGIVAKFKVEYAEQEDFSAGLDNIDLTGMKPGDTKSYQIQVTNNSEVSVSYTLTVETFGNLPLTCTLVRNGTQSVNSAGGVLSSEGLNDIWTLNVTWNHEDNNISYANMIDVVRVVVDFEQIN